MKSNKTHRCSTRCSGSALVYILIAIALLAALTASFMKPASQQTTSQNTFNTITELNSQINFIRSAIQECVLSYPAGDSALIGTLNTPYPINPTSTYLLSPAALEDFDFYDTDDGELVRFLGCPGNPGNSNDHAKIFSGQSGKFMPPTVNLFTEWLYYNHVDGVYILIGTEKSDAFLETALKKLDNQYSECEADFIDASGGAVVLNSTGGIMPAGFKGFRVWLITNGSAVYNGDADGDEAACP